MSDLLEPCLFFGCTNPCLRGLALTPFRKCINKYKDLSNNDFKIVCTGCGKFKDYENLTYVKNGKYYCDECFRSFYSRKRGREYIQKIRIKALLRICDPPICLACGEKDVDLLCTDHIQDDGAIEREKLSTTQIWKKIIKMPVEQIKSEYQILCRNCNWKKERNRRKKEY